VIKVNIEYTLIGTNVFEVKPTISADPTSTVIEKIMAESIRIISMDVMEKQGKPDGLENILSGIGR
jgi:hypothetical protein